MSTNAIKWTPGPPPEPRNGKVYLICLVGTQSRWVDVIGPQTNVGKDDARHIQAHALINYPLAINEAAHEHENRWHYWDLNGTARSTGYATREEAEAAYRDEYGDR